MVADERTRRYAALGAIGGAIFLPYALTKGAIATRIADGGARVPGLTDAATADAFHLFETVPMLLLALGIVAVADHFDVARGTPAWAGMLVALTGIATTIVFHWGEHLLHGPTLPGTGVTLFATGYYLGWVMTNAGLFVCGGSLLVSEEATFVPALLALSLPLALVIGALVVAFDVYTFAGTNRVVASGTWILVGTWVWAAERRAPANRDAAEPRSFDAK